MPPRKTARPSREEGRLVLRLLRDLVPVAQWLGPERAAVTAFHRWAHGAPPNLDEQRPEPEVGPSTPSGAGSANRPIRAGDPVGPLPSEVLESVDGGRGIVGWILTPADLDHLRVLSRDPVAAGTTYSEALGGGNSSPNPDDWTPEPPQPAEERALAEGQIEHLGAWIAENVPGEPSRPEGAVSCAIRVLGELLDRDGRPVADEPEDPRTEETIRREERASPHPVEDDPRRPSLDHYPEDAILLTYREVRRVIALHLETCANPLVARAMRDGETPLRLAEVLDR